MYGLIPPVDTAMYGPVWPDETKSIHTQPFYATVRGYWFRMNIVGTSVSKSYIQAARQYKSIVNAGPESCYYQLIQFSSEGGAVPLSQKVKGHYSRH